MGKVLVIGGGPAGAAAAIAAAGENVSVQLFERSPRPKHKVCGEFLSPGALRVLDSLGIADFAGLRPARIATCRLWFGQRKKEWRFGEPALGLSRLELDRILLERAEAAGAEVHRGESVSLDEDNRDGGARVVSVGRRPSGSRENRLFGFKAHFEGPQDDAIELFFGRHAYVGVSPIENGWTNVCGIAPEAALRSCGFQVDEYLGGFPVLAERLQPLRRRMEWLRTGPLSYAPVSASEGGQRVYAAGDALGFVDPFTGSGILNALFTGRLAGRNAAHATPCASHLRECRAHLSRPFGISAICRKLLEWNCARHLAALTPGAWIFRLTRAQISD
ncbi:MAG TPA: FAD-dependent monooxygenase [Bryobacteraceae bacterium]|nr:FAD-dependent monooxygenase [Bryobacteraceae bacterium]